jgi:phage terminase large subunit-like protein
VDPQGGKESRAHAVSPQIEAGNVYLPDPASVSWVGDFIEECASFPKGAYDDQVDAMSQALLRLEQNRYKNQLFSVEKVNEALCRPSYWNRTRRWE